MKKIKNALLCAVIAVSLIGTAHAEDTTLSDDWQFDAMLYLWGADFSGQFGPNADFLITFDDLVDNMEMGFMGLFQARKGKLSMFIDAVHLEVASDQTNVSDGIIPVMSAINCHINRLT